MFLEQSLFLRGKITYLSTLQLVCPMQSIDYPGTRELRGLIGPGNWAEYPVLVDPLLHSNGIAKNAAKAIKQQIKTVYEKVSCYCF